MCIFTVIKLLKSYYKRSTLHISTKIGLISYNMQIFHLQATERARGTGGTVSADSGSADLAVGETSRKYRTYKIS